MHCTHLVLVSKDFGCVLGTLRISEVAEVVWEFGNESGTGALSREESKEVKYEARSLE